MTSENDVYCMCCLNNDCECGGTAHQLEVFAGTADQTGKDSKALDRIQHMLRDPQWGVGMLEDIAEIVEATGRTTSNYPDDRETWGRH